MSRIGNRVLELNEKTSAEIENNIIKIKGPKGELSLSLTKDVVVKVVDNTIVVEKAKENVRSNVMQGTTNSLINNMIEGVMEGFSKSLEIMGVGYRFQLQGNTLIINAGFSHQVKLEIPKEIKVEMISNTEITISGISKELVGEFSANVRKVRKPEPYKGKGIRYKNEIVRRKEGKKASK